MEQQHSSNGRDDTKGRNHRITRMRTVDRSKTIHPSSKTCSDEKTLIQNVVGPRSDPSRIGEAGGAMRRKTQCGLLFYQSPSWAQLLSPDCLGIFVGLLLPRRFDMG